jgi:Flp pilus assembly protein TadB
LAGLGSNPPVERDEPSQALRGYLPDMAQTRRRRRKHRGTQSGSIDRRRASRPRSRQEARARARKQMGNKREGPPAWSSAVTRGVFGAGVFLLLLVVIFRRPVAASVILSLFMLLIYIPLGHLIDGFMYNRRLAAKQRERERRLDGE